MRNVQDTILNQLRKDRITTTIYLINGVQVRGKILGFDQFSVLVEANKKQMLVYKHAISTIQPEMAVSLERTTEAAISR